MEFIENGDDGGLTRILFTNLEDFGSIEQIHTAFGLQGKNILPGGSSTNSDLGHQVEGLHLLSRALISLIERIAASSGVELAKKRKRCTSAGMAERIYAERFRRNQYFPVGLFGEPAWDILLDLFAADEKSELRAIKEICINSHVPDATALRYIAQLAALGLVKHSPDRTDNRRKFLRLTAEGRHCVASYLESMPTIGDEASDLASVSMKVG